jgi:hypothetical protein
MHAHDAIVALHTSETSLLPIMGSQVLMVLHTGWKIHPFPDRLSVYDTIKVHPFAAILGPCLAAKGYRHARCDHFFFQRPEMFTYHDLSSPP